MAITTVKGIKEIGWDKIKLSDKNGFGGAVKSYKATTGRTIALCFNTTEAFIVEDNMGLFAVQDLYSGLLRAKEIDVESTGTIVGAKTVAFIDEDTNEVLFIPDEIVRLGLTTDEIKEDIKNRITNLFLFLTATKDIM